MVAPFVGIRTFLKAPVITNKHKIFNIIGVPYDLSTTFRSGSRMGPSAIREASMMLTDGDHPRYHINPVELGLVYDAGDIEIKIADTYQYLYDVQSNILNFEHTILLGGDHSITLAALRAMKLKYGAVSMIQFDAHADTWDGQPNHGTFVRQAIQESLIDPFQSIQIGIRSPIPNNIRVWGNNQGLLNIPSWEVHENKISDIILKIKNHIKINTPVYLTFDIDCLDPSVAPGTGTPEIGGLFSHQVSEILYNLSDLNWVGMDMMEVCPAYDNNQITSLAAATIIWNYICQITKIRGLK